MQKILNLFILMIIKSTLMFAQWTNDPTLNTPVCISPGEQQNPLIISDGNNGAIICWMDVLTVQVYVQRINSSGYKMWDPLGLRITPLSDYHPNYSIISDQQGGAILTWETYNNGDENIYAQRLDSFGNLLWDTLGVEICVKPLPQIQPIITSDGLVVLLFCGRIGRAVQVLLGCMHKELIPRVKCYGLQMVYQFALHHFQIRFNFIL